MLRECRHAFRALWLNKGFAAVAIACLALGIGLNTTIFSVVDGVLIQSLPYQDPASLVEVSGANPKADITDSSVSFPDFDEWRRSTKTLSALAALTNRSLAIADGSGEPERFSSAEVSWNMFPMLGVKPILGRPFSASDDRTGAAGVVMLSYSVWMRRYQGDPHVIGRRILVNAAPTEIIGIMPQDFEFPNNQKLWVPLDPLESTGARSTRNLALFGRLAPDTSLAQAQADLNALAARLAAAFPATNENWETRITRLQDEFIPPDIVLVISLMMAGVTLVLLIACANVANLQLARATVRQREIAVRTALGAGRGRIIRQLLMESVLLGLASVPLGLAIAYFGDRAMTAMVPPDGIPSIIHWRIDWRSASYSIAIAVGTALVFGLVPAWQATRGNLQSSLKEGTRGNTGGRGWARNILVGAEVAMAVVALVGAMLFVRSFRNLDSFNIGFDPKPLMSMRYYLAGTAYEPQDAKLRRVRDIVERVEALPGVRAAYSSNFIPIDGGGSGGDVVIEGKPIEPGRRSGIVLAAVSPHFFKTIGQKLEGENFTEAEGWSRTPVAVVNRTMADRFWKNESAIGKRFRLQGGLDTQEWFTVIGVAADILHDNVNPSKNRAVAAAYVPYPYQQTMNTGLVISAAGDPASIASSAREAIRASDANLAVFGVNTMDAVRARSFWQFGLFGWVFSTIGIVGLVLAAIGVYGVLGYSVSQRTQEIGVRLALGAEHRSVLMMIVGQGVRLALGGVAVGLALSAVLMPAARALLYNVSPFDPMSFAAVAVFLTLVAALASYAPARRAMSVSPTQALRGGE